MSIQSRSILFVTGAFVSNKCWDDWKTFFESKGYTTIAPAWPQKDGPPDVLRSQHPHSPIAKLRLKDVIDSYASAVKQLPEKPIIIGHSLGGLMTQVLVNRGLSAAGVAIHPVPPQFVIPYEISFYKACLPALGFFTPAKEDYLMTFKQWQYAFTNGMPENVQQAEYDKFVIPESKLAARDGLSSVVRIDFSKPHAPLLIVSGTADTIIPASLNKRNFKRYKQNNGSVTEYLEVKDRNHHVLGLPTWQEDAQQILDWIEKN